MNNISNKIIDINKKYNIKVNNNQNTEANKDVNIDQKQNIIVYTKWKTAIGKVVNAYEKLIKSNNKAKKLDMSRINRQINILLICL